MYPVKAIAGRNQKCPVFVFWLEKPIFGFCHENAVFIDKGVVIRSIPPSEDRLGPARRGRTARRRKTSAL
jgi:hypothetical protein